MRPLVAAALAATVAASILTGCTTEGDRAARPAAGADADAEITSFALGLGVDPLDRAALDRLGAHDLVVVDGETTTTAEVAALRRRGATVLGYLSIGTVEPYRPWFAAARLEGWLLERWPDWDEWYADVAASGLRDLLLAEAGRTLAKGFDGLFLDNADMVESHPAQGAGMRRLVADLDRLVGPDRLLMAQNGDASVDAIADHLDAWNREDVTATYDHDTERYLAVPVEDRRAASATIARLAARGLTVTATDYVPADDAALAARAQRVACRAGAVPYVADIGLTRVPAEPRTCP